MILILLGPPGVGKGTQGDLIKAKLGIPKITTGDILRQEVKEGTPLGRKAASYMKNGDLVPDDLIIEMIGKRIKLDDCKKGFVLDGFPRTVAQAEAFDVMLDKYGLELDRVILLSVSDEEIVRRLSGRRVCEKCGAVYHIEFNPPAAQGICDKCGGRLIQRDDDKKDTILNRLKVYRELTMPLIDYYRKKGLLSEVNGEGSVEDVFKDILREIG